jgi:hypothetical protein
LGIKAIRRATFCAMPLVVALSMSMWLQSMVKKSL